MRTNSLKVHISKDWCFIAFSLFFIILVSSFRNRVMAASDKLNQGTTTAVVDESVQDSTSDRIIYSPNGDIVDEEGIYIVEPLDTNEIYIVVENMPMFPGGSDALLDYLSKNVRYPKTTFFKRRKSRYFPPQQRESRPRVIPQKCRSVCTSGY